MAVTILIAVADSLDKSTPCESLRGYNPGGATPADRYPPDTWAGLCQEVKNGEKQKRMQLVGTLLLIAYPAAGIVWLIRRHV